MTLPKDMNQHTTAHNVSDEEKPQIIDSSVNGFPFGKYVSIVAPSCEKSGFITAVKSISGMRAFSHSLFSCEVMNEYARPEISDVRLIAGC